MATPPRRELGQYAAVAQVGFEMAVPIGLGWLLDRYFETLPWCMVGGAVLGLILGVTHLVVLMNAAERNWREERKEKSS